MSNQLMLFASAGNPLPQEEKVVSAGFLKSAFPKAVRLLNEADIVLRRKALLTISELLTNAASCIQLIDKGVIVVLSECLASEDEVVQERAAHDINIIITIVGSKGCENLLRTGAVENLILLLSSSSENVRHATYDVLMNACKRSSEIQDLLCDMKGLLENLLLQVEQMGLVDSRKALGLIRTCLAGRRRPGDDVARRLVCEETLSILARVMNTTVDDTTVDESLLDAATVVMSLLCSEPGTKKDIIRAGIVPILTVLLKNHVQVDTKTAAAAALMHLSIDILGKTECIKFGITRYLIEGLGAREDHETFILNCLQCITNVAENKEGRKQFHVLEQKLEILTYHASKLIQHEAALALRSIRFKVVGE